jgi:hypothetical protein
VLKQHTAKKIVHGRSLTRHTAKIWHTTSILEGTVCAFRFHAKRTVMCTVFCRELEHRKVIYFAKTILFSEQCP